MTSYDEQRLIQLTRDGDYDAFNRLVIEYQDAVFAVVLRTVRNRAAAEDITQDAFISAFRKISSYRGGIFRAWLFRIAKNSSLDYLRKVARRSEKSIDEDIVYFAEIVKDDTQDPVADALNSELARLIEHCMGSLSEDHRFAMVMIDVEGYQYDEAAESARVSIGTVKSRLNRARARMRDCVQQEPELLPTSLRL
ncbi:MAG: sigma-70 family RNA polymerase sigma factor [Dehalococcoidia bacterium]|nr:RNA polymerase subunit sigma-24 [Chloroflexota bacterium]MDP6055612.1 sigma-70 family RNA polymerase sigma factor [Dehalococcoidia bacterium]MDP7261306.1 sigma-70 family RNA polymerase sigma factor [Dehalococcoidia bacterium]MDP7485978.1 sigma-70 family RNA polymerase sigma factor [Dehalococcoidia bacterium]